MLADAHSWVADNADNGATSGALRPALFSGCHHGLYSRGHTWRLNRHESLKLVWLRWLSWIYFSLKFDWLVEVGWLRLVGWGWLVVNDQETDDSSSTIHQSLRTIMNHTLFSIMNHYAPKRLISHLSLSRKVYGMMCIKWRYPSYLSFKWSTEIPWTYGMVGGWMISRHRLPPPRCCVRICWGSQRFRSAVPRQDKHTSLTASWPFWEGCPIWLEKAIKWYYTIAQFQAGAWTQNKHGVKPKPGKPAGWCHWMIRVVSSLKRLQALKLQVAFFEFGEEVMWSYPSQLYHLHLRYPWWNPWFIGCWSTHWLQKIDEIDDVCSSQMTGKLLADHDGYKPLREVHGLLVFDCDFPLTQWKTATWLPVKQFEVASIGHGVAPTN